jgi:hypothetical protein
MDATDETDYLHVASNLSVEDRKKNVHTFRKLTSGRHGEPVFSTAIGNRIRISELYLERHPLDPFVEQVRVVCHTKIEDDMMDSDGHLSYGCIFYLVDVYVITLLSSHVL